MFDHIRTRKQAQARLIDIEYEMRELEAGHRDFVEGERQHRAQCGQRLYEHLLRAGCETIGADGLRVDTYTQRELQKLREEERLLRHHMLNLSD